MVKMKRGWFGESYRHRLARYGIKTSTMTNQEIKLKHNKMFNEQKKKKGRFTEDINKQDKIYAVYDLQTNQYLHSGRNTKSIQEAVEDVWSYWEGGADFDEEELKTMREWDLKKRKGWLEGLGFRFDELDEKLPEGYE